MATRTPPPPTTSGTYNPDATANAQSIPALTVTADAARVNPEMFPTPPNTVYFPFIHEDDEGKLFPLAASYLTIGEFELAKATLIEACKINPQKAFEFLDKVITNGPTAEWLATKSVPSAGHIIWLCISTHDELRKMCLSGDVALGNFKVPERISDTIRADAEFEIVLYNCFKSTPNTPETKKWLDKLRSIRKAILDGDAGEIARFSFSDEVLSNIKALIERDPSAAMEFTSLLVPYSAKPFPQVSSPIHRLWAERIQSLLDEKQFDEAVRSLRWLSFRDETVLTAEDAKFCRDVFTRIVELSDVAQQSQVVTKNDIFQSLLASPSTGPLKCYCKAEEMYLKKVIEKREYGGNAFLPISFEFLKAGSSKESVEQFWSHYSYYVYCTKVHFMEHALLCAISLLKEGRFDEAKLCIEPFERLRPLLLLAGWDINPDDAEYRSKLINILWSEIVPSTKNELDEEDKFGAACNDLKYILDLSRWSAEQIMKHGNTPVDSAMDEWKLTNEVTKLIPKHSLPFVLSKCIENVSPSEVIGHIESNPNKNAENAVSQDVALMQSYEVLHVALMFMLSEDGNGKNGKDLEELPGKVRSIESCWVKVSLIQEMFCLLFLKDETTGDFIASAEKCSALLSVLNACILDISDESSGRDEKTVKALARLRADIKEVQSRFLFAKALYKDGAVTSDGIKLPTVFVQTLLADSNDLLALAIQFGDYELADMIKAEFGNALDNGLVKASRAGKIVDDNLTGLCGGSAASADLVDGSDGEVIADVAFQVASNLHVKQLFKVALGKVISDEDKSYARVVSLMDAMVSGDNLETDSSSSSCSAAEAFALYSGKFAQNAAEQVRLTEAKTSLDSAVKILMNIHSGDEHDAEDDRKAIEEIQKALDHAKGSSFDCIGVFLDYITRVTEVIKESKLPTYFGVLAKRPDELIRDLVFYNHNYKTASQLADLFHLDLDSILIEEVAGKINESCFADNAPAGTSTGEGDRMIYHFAEYLREKWPNLSVLMTLLKSPSDEFHPELISHVLKCASDATPLGAWIRQQRKHFELFYKVFCCDCAGLDNEADVDFATMETPIKLSGRGAEALQNMCKWNEKSLEQFYCCIIDELCDHNMERIALEIADRMMPNGAPDYLLEKVILCTPPEDSWKYVERIKDPLKAGALSLDFMHKWDDISVCLKLVKSCDNMLTHKGDSGKSETERKLHEQRLKLELYESIIKLEDERWTKWQDIDNKAECDGKALVNDLLSINKYDLALRLQRIFNMGDAVHRDILESQLLYMLLNNESNSGAMLLALCEMGTGAVKVVESLLAKMRMMKMFDEVQVAKASLTLIQFLLRNMSDTLDTDYTKKLEEQKLGFQVFLLLSEELQKAYGSLVSKPFLVFENMLMDKRLSESRSLLDGLRRMNDNTGSVSDAIDNIILVYAKKALQEPKKDSDENDDVENGPAARLRVDEDEWNAQKRLEYAYSGTPDVNLASAILDLGNNKINIGVMCLAFCRELSSGLTEKNAKGIEIADVILRVLSYAKAVLQRENDYDDESGKKRMEALMNCESFISGTELFEMLVRSQCAYGLSLTDILQPVKARWLRDKLIENDMLTLAIDVATRCNLSAGKVWEHWGFALLGMGNYAEAREKFRHCLKSFKRRGVIDDDSDPQELLARIIDKLESRQETDEGTLRGYLQNFQDLLQNRISGQKCELISLNNFVNESQEDEGPLGRTLSKEAFEECKYYLQTYGAPRQMVAFFVKHNRVEEACQYSFDVNLSPQQFLDEVILYCVSHSTMHLLRRALLSVDRGFVKSKEYIIAACAFFNKHQAYEILLSLQRFAEDYARAGITAILMFKAIDDPNDFAQRLQTLDLAKKLLDDALMQRDPIIPTLSPSEIALRLNVTEMQLQVLKLFQDNAKSVPPDVLKLSSFGPIKDVMMIAIQTILLDGYDLAYQLVQNFKLPSGKVYGAAVGELARGKQMSKITELFKQIKAVIIDQEFDNIVLVAIKVFVKEQKDKKSGEKLLGYLVRPNGIVLGNRLCGKYKTAYMTAARDNLVDEIRVIYQECKDVDPKTADFCKRYLDGYQPTNIK